jgi:hypothetical protein
MNFFWPSFWRGTRVAVELIDRVAPSHFVSLVCHYLLANFRAVEVLEELA